MVIFRLLMDEEHSMPKLAKMALLELEDQLMSTDPQSG